MAANKKTPNIIDFDSSLSQDSLDYLKINKQPFAADILTQETFFSFPALNKIIENLQHQVQFSDLLLIIEGPYGSGKTSLFRNLLLHDIENTKSLPILAEATDTLVQIQQKISEHLQDLGDANHLDDNLKSLESFNQTPLVIIDNCHVLSDTTLQELIRYKDQLKNDHDINLKFILFANNGISNTLQNISALDSNQMYVQSMPEYSGALTAELISHKLKKADYTGDILLNENELQLIDKKSQLTPLSIMHIAADIIEKNIALALNPPKPIWVKALIGFAILITMSLASSIYFGVIDIEKTLSPTQESADPTTITQEPNTNINKDSLPALELTTAPENTNEDMIVVENPEPDQPVTLDTKDRISSTLTDNTNKPVTPTLSPSENKNQTLTKEPSTSDVITKSLLPASSDNIDAMSESPTTTLQEITPQKETTTKNISSSDSVIKKTKPINPALEQLNAMGLHDADWLLKQKNTDWTLQLLGAREPETLLIFSRQHSLTDNASWYKTWLKGKPYYVLVYGNYANRDMAREAIAALPTKLRSIKPWAKSIKSVQQSIK